MHAWRLNLFYQLLDFLSLSCLISTVALLFHALSCWIFCSFPHTHFHACVPCIDCMLKTQFVHTSLLLASNSYFFIVQSWQLYKRWIVRSISENTHFLVQIRVARPSESFIRARIILFFAHIVASISFLKLDYGCFKRTNLAPRNGYESRSELRLAYQIRPSEF